MSVVSNNVLRLLQPTCHTLWSPCTFWCSISNESRLRAKNWGPLQGAISAQKPFNPSKVQGWDKILRYPPQHKVFDLPSRHLNDLFYKKGTEKKWVSYLTLCSVPGFQRGWLQSYKMRYGLIWTTEFCNSNPTGANCLQLTNSLPVLDCYSQSLYLPTATP